jgi:hypothetical protein
MGTGVTPSLLPPAKLWMAGPPGFPGVPAPKAQTVNARASLDAYRECAYSYEAIMRSSHERMKY